MEGTAEKKQTFPDPLIEGSSPLLFSSSISYFLLPNSPSMSSEKFNSNVIGVRGILKQLSPPEREAGMLHSDATSV